MIYVDAIYYHEAKKDGRKDKLPGSFVLVMGNYSASLPVWKDKDEYHGCMFAQQKPGTDILGKFKGRIRFVSCNLHCVLIDERVDHEDCMISQKEIIPTPVSTKDETDMMIDRVGVDVVMAKLGGERVAEYISKSTPTDAKFEEMKVALADAHVSEEVVSELIIDASVKGFK